ncbi:hypothetical protein N431DRAFT_543398 [Stipitochalara longipes BDJ]|nr:hypothetical protein N431DRAFT_543398 [Stipitochalara longipes BDJ]
MSDNEPDRGNLLRQKGTDPSDMSNAITPPRLPHHRHGYHRMNSQGSADFPPDRVSNFSSNGIDNDDNTYGLGITARIVSINRVPVGSRKSITSPPSPSKPFTPSTGPRSSPMSPPTPGSSTLLLSPASPWQRHDSGNHTLAGGSSLMEEIDEQDISKGKTPYNESFEIGGAEEDTPPPRPLDDHDDNDNDKKGLLNRCPTIHDIHSSRASWLSISVLMLSIYSTIFSGIWLILAMIQPRYGRTIKSGRSFSPATASTLFALFAKTIELSFVTVFVTFLGQVLSRRSFVKASRGVTIPELTMRTWVIQPGFLITHWQHIQHAGFTVLSAITLTAAVVAVFYTTASDALVSPHLKYGKWESQEMWGLVQASYANQYYIMANCQTPITAAIDDASDAGDTCLSMEHAGQAYHNSLAYLDTWTQISKGGEGVSSNLSERPLPVGMLFDNTTVTGSWVQTNTSDLTVAYEKYARIVNNVTMSMPHAGVFSAAHDAKNGILQPKDLEGVGEYSVRASVVSPTINVLCVNMNSTELKPLVYTQWPYAKTNNSDNGKIAWSGYQNEIQLQPGQTWLNKTVVDDIFEWGATYARQPPVFPMFPIDYNSLTNITVANSDSIYILIKSSAIPDYTMCQVRSFVSPACSTQYNVSGTGQGSLQSHCEDAHDPDAYIKSVEGAPVIRTPDWRSVGQDWALSLSFNSGISSANSSTARLLSQFIYYVPPWGAVQLNPLLPSISEVLAVMAGSTLLLGSMGSTYYHFWNYTANELDPGVYLNFNASLASQQYTSGPLQRWQGIFYIVLLLVFATNVFCLVYFFLRSGLVTDYTEPANLFAIAVNSPPSERLSGSCGAGPERRQLNVPFHVRQEEGSNHFFIKEGDEPGGGEFELRRRRRDSQGLKSMTSYSKLSSKRRSFL